MSSPTTWLVAPIASCSGTDPTKVWRAVTERFGDPGAVARRLWQDAMKEKIMAQRILIATCLFVTAASLALVGMFWMQSTRVANELAETNRRMVETLTENQVTNREVLKQLQGLAKSVRVSQASEWIPVTFKLTQETMDGPPAVGCRVILEGKTESMTRFSDANGNVDFGVVRPGDCNFRILETWDESGDLWQTIGSVNAVPGSTVSKAIICPKTPLTPRRSEFVLTGRQTSLTRNFNVAVSFEHQGLTLEGPFTRRYHSSGRLSLVQRDFICGPKSIVASIADPNEFYFWCTNSEYPKGPVYADLHADQTTGHQTSSSSNAAIISSSG